MQNYLLSDLQHSICARIHSIYGASTLEEWQRVDDFVQSGGTAYGVPAMFSKNICPLEIQC